MMNKISRIHWGIWYALMSNIILYSIAVIDNGAKSTLPAEIHWTERYFAYISYLSKRFNGVKCTYDEVFYEEVILPFEKAINEFERQRNLREY